jgi:hypothetical protein
VTLFIGNLFRVRLPYLLLIRRPKPNINKHAHVYKLNCAGIKPATKSIVGIQPTTPNPSSTILHVGSGMARTDSDHSLASVEDTVVSSSTDRDGRTVTTTTTTTTRTRNAPAHARTETQERSFLDSSTKVTGVQDILTRMKNADIGKSRVFYTDWTITSSMT